MRETSLMAKMLQVRNIPDRLHRELVRRARREGRTVTEYVQRILEREVSRPPREQVFERIAKRKPVALDESAAASLAAERGSKRST